MLQIDLPARVVTQVGPAGDCGDLVLGIVNDNSELIGVDAVTAFQHEITRSIANTLLRPGVAFPPLDQTIVNAHAHSVVIQFKLA